MSRAALVRGDDGGLHVRRFASQEDARAAEDHREVAPERRRTRSGSYYTTGQLARVIGLSRRTIMRRCAAGEIPAEDHGTAGQARYMILPATVKLIRIHGLRGLARMRQAGLLCAAFASLFLGGCDRAPKRAAGSSLPKAEVEQRLKALSTGYQVARIAATGSMLPTMDERSMALLERVQLSDIQTGDIVAYLSTEESPGRLIVHRAVRRTSGGWVVRGDALDHDDAELVTEANLRGRLVCLVYTSGR